MSQKSYHILYLNNYTPKQDLIRETLEEVRGEFVFIEASTREAFEKALVDGNCDLVLSDLDVLHFEGLDVLFAIQEKNSAIPVIIVTDAGEEETAAEAMKRGAADYVIKSPQHIRRLPRAIQAALENKALRAARQQDAHARDSLLAVTSALKNAASHEEIVTVIAKQVRAIFSASSVVLATQDPVTHETIIPAYPEEDEVELGEIRLQAGRGVVGTVIATGKAYANNDVSTDPNVLNSEHLGENLALACVPLVIQEEVIGALWVCRKAPITEKEVNLLTSIGDFAANALHRAILHQQAQAHAQQLDKQNRELTRLYRVSAALITSASPDLQNLAQEVVNIVSQEFGDCNCSLLLVNEETEELQRIAIAGVQQITGYPPTLALNSPGLITKVIQTGQIINAANVSEHLDYFKVWEDAQAEIVIPLKLGERTFGALDVQSTELGAFTPDDERILSIFAQRAALALANARFQDETQRRAAQLDTVSAMGYTLGQSFNLNDIYSQLTIAIHNLFPGISTVAIRQHDVTHKLLTCNYAQYEKQALNVDAIAPFTLDPEGRDALNEVVYARRPVCLNDLSVRPDGLTLPEHISTKPQAALLAPMVARRDVIGVLHIQSLTPHHFRKVHVELLTLVANTAAIAITNAQMFTRTLQHLEQLQALQNVDMAISGSLDLRVTLNVLLEQVTTQLNVHAASVLLLNRHTHTLEYTAGRGFHTNAIAQTRARLGQGYAGQAALNHRLVHVPDLAVPGNNFLRQNLLASEKFTTYFAVPLIAKGKVLGILEVFNRNRFKFTPEWINFLETLAGQAAIAADNAALFDELQRSNADLILAYDATIEGWARALELRDKETKGHSQRVTDMAVRLARAMGMRNEELVHTRRGALLHDIGKMGIPDQILFKEGKLTAEEWEIMKKHPGYAYNMLSNIPYLRPALAIPHSHHEKWDGTGYPRGLKQEEIPLAARIFTIIDVWDALRSDRPYRDAWSDEEVTEYIIARSGKDFDPRVVDAFLRLWKPAKT